MNDIAGKVLARLDALGIRYRALRHPAAYTMADCAALDAQLGAMTVKNIFLTTKNAKHYYLCLTRPNARFHTADISRQVGSSRLSFAPEEKLYELLKAHAGSASPMGLIFDTEHRVGLLVDEALKEERMLAFHPCDNTQTVAMTAADFFDVFLKATGTAPVFVTIHDFDMNGLHA